MRDKDPMTHRRWDILLPTLSQYAPQTQRMLRQRYCDYIKIKVLITTLCNHIKHMYAWYAKQDEEEDSIDWAVARSMLPERQHLLFTASDMKSYGLYPGAPPADDKRPVWLKGINLDVDYAQLSDEVWRKCAPGGEYAQIISDWQEYNPQQQEQFWAKNRIIDSPIIIQ